MFTDRVSGKAAREVGSQHPSNLELWFVGRADAGAASVANDAFTAFSTSNGSDRFNSRYRSISTSKAGLPL